MLWKIEHVLKLERVGRTEFEHYTRNSNLFTGFIDCDQNDFEEERNQSMLKVLSDASYITNECTSLVNLHDMYEQQKQNFTEQQEKYVIKRMLMAADRIDNGKCFSPLDPRNTNVKKKGKSDSIVSGYSNDDINMSGSMRTNNYWPKIFWKDKHLKKVKTCVKNHVEGFCKGVHELVWSLQNRLSDLDHISFRDPLKNVIPTLPILSIEDWRKVVTQMYMKPPTSHIEAQKMLMIRNTFHYPISLDNNSGNFRIGSVGWNEGASKSAPKGAPRSSVPMGRIQDNARRAGTAKSAPRGAPRASVPIGRIQDNARRAGTVSKPAPSDAKNQNAVKPNPPSSIDPKKQQSSKPSLSTAPEKQSTVRSNPPSLTAPQKKQNSIAVKSNNPSEISSFIKSKKVPKVAEAYRRWSMKGAVKKALPTIRLLEEVPFDQVMDKLPFKIVQLLKYRTDISKEIRQFVHLFPYMLPAYAAFTCETVDNRIGLCPLSVLLCANPLSTAMGETFLLADKYPCCCSNFLGPSELITHCESAHNKIHGGAFVQAMKAILLGSGVKVPEVQRTVDESSVKVPEVQRTVDESKEAERPDAAGIVADNADETGGKPESSDSKSERKSSESKDDADQSKGGGDSNSERESGDRLGNNNNNDRGDEENNNNGDNGDEEKYRDSSDCPDADDTESSPTQLDISKIEDCREYLIDNPIDIDEWGTTEERNLPEKELCVPMIGGKTCGRLYPRLFSSMVCDSPQKEVDTKWDIGHLNSFLSTLLHTVKLPDTVYVHPSVIKFAMKPDFDLVGAFGEDVMDTLKCQMKMRDEKNSAEQKTSLILISSQSGNVTCDEAPDHVGLLVLNSNPADKSKRIDLGVKDSQYKDSITVHDPYGSFDKGAVLSILRKFAFDLGSSSVKPKERGAFSLPAVQSTFISKIDIKTEGDEDACAPYSMEKLIAIMKILKVANMIDPLDMKADSTVKDKMAVVIAQYLLRYLESDKLECDDDPPGFYQSFVIRERKLEQSPYKWSSKDEQSPYKWSSKDISIRFLKSLVESPNQRIDQLDDYRCICSRIVNSKEPRIICTNCYGEYHPGCFEYYAGQVGENGRLFCHQCNKQMSANCPPVFQTPNAVFKESGKLMYTIAEGTIVLDNILTSDVDRTLFFKEFREITNDYNCSSGVADDNDFRAFCQLITVNASLNNRDALTEHEAIMSKTAIEIAEALGGTLQKYQSEFESEFANLRGPKLQRFADKLKGCSTDSYSNLMRMEVDEQVERMSTVASISIAGFYFTKESQASDTVQEVVKYCREKLDHDASNGISTQLLESFHKANQHEGYKSKYINKLTNGSTEERAQFLKLIVSCVLRLPEPLLEKYFYPSLEEQIKKHQDRQSNKRKKEMPSSSRDNNELEALALMCVLACPNVKVASPATVTSVIAGDHNTLIQRSIELYDKASPWKKPMDRESFIKSAPSALEHSDDHDISNIIRAVENIWQHAGSSSNSDADVKSPVKKRPKHVVESCEEKESDGQVNVEGGKGESTLKSDTGESRNNDNMEIESDSQVNPNSGNEAGKDAGKEGESMEVELVDGDKGGSTVASDNNDNMEIDSDGQVNVNRIQDGQKVTKTSDTSDGIDKEPASQTNANNKDVEASKSQNNDGMDRDSCGQDNVSVHLYYCRADGEDEWTLSANKPDKVIGKGDTITFLEVALRHDPAGRKFKVSAIVGDFIPGPKQELPFKLLRTSDDKSKSMSNQFFNEILNDAATNDGQVIIEASGESVALDQLGVRVPTGTTYFFEWIAITCGLEFKHSHTDDELTLKKLQSSFESSDPYQNYLVHYAEELDKRFRNQRSKQKFCFPVGRYHDLRDKYISSCGKHHQLDLLWNTIVLPHGDSRMMIEYNALQQTTVQGSLDSCPSKMSDEVKLAKLYISEESSFHERREPKNVMRVESNNDVVMINQDDSDVVATVGGEEAAQAAVSLGVVHAKPTTARQPRLLRIVQSSDKFKDMRDHSPYSWEVMKFTDIFYIKIITDVIILKAVAPLLLCTMALFPDSDKFALDRHLNRPYDDELDSSINEYVIKPFRRFVDFCDATKSPSYEKIPDWWNVPPKSYKDDQYFFGVKRKCNLIRLCPYGKVNCTLLRIRPLFLLRYEVTPAGMTSLNTLQESFGDVHCDNSVLSQSEDKQFAVARKTSKDRDDDGSFIAMYRGSGNLMNNIVEIIQKSQEEHGNKCYDVGPMEKVRSGVEKLCMDSILGHTVLAENQQKVADAEKLFKMPVSRFAYAIQKRILSLREIAKHDKPKCFGGCGVILNKDNTECDWQTHMERICKEMSKLEKSDEKMITKWKAFLKTEEEKKRKEEDKGNYGYKICKACYPGRKINWPKDD